MSVARTLAYVASRGISSAMTFRPPMKPALAPENSADLPLVAQRPSTAAPVLERVKLKRTKRSHAAAETHLFAAEHSATLINPRNAA